MHPLDTQAMAVWVSLIPLLLASGVRISPDDMIVRADGASWLQIRLSDADREELATLYGAARRCLTPACDAPLPAPRRRSPFGRRATDARPPLHLVPPADQKKQA
jgi:hypothetical protein